MSIINFRRKEIIAKVVYYGPGLSGKTTNVQKIHAGMPSETRGELTSLATEEERTLFFDYIPIHLGNIGGFKTRFQIFTVPGQVYYSATRRIVLQGADGVVFVADSGRDALVRNKESLEDLRSNLLHYDKLLSAIPFVIQYNKRDLVQAMTLADLNRELNPTAAPSVEAVAVDNKGVMETLSKISSLVLTHLKASIEGKLNQGRKDPGIIERFDEEEVSDETLVRNLLEQISQVRPHEVHAEVNIVDEDDSLPRPISAASYARAPNLPPLPSMSAVGPVHSDVHVEYEVTILPEVSAPPAPGEDDERDSEDESDELEDSQKLIIGDSDHAMAAAAAAFDFEESPPPPPIPPRQAAQARSEVPGSMTIGVRETGPAQRPTAAANGAAPHRSDEYSDPGVRAQPPIPAATRAPSITPASPARSTQERSTVAAFQPGDSPPWDARSRANGAASGPPRAAGVPLGRLEVLDVGQVSRQGSELLLPLTLKDLDNGATRNLDLRLNLGGDVKRILNEGMPSYIHIWLIGLSAATFLALILAIF